MEPTQDKIQNIYNYLQQSGVKNLPGTKEEFEQRLTTDSTIKQNVYNFLSEQGIKNFPQTVEDFDSAIGFKKKEVTGTGSEMASQGSTPGSTDQSQDLESNIFVTAGTIIKDFFTNTLPATISGASAALANPNTITGPGGVPPNVAQAKVEDKTLAETTQEQNDNFERSKQEAVAFAAEKLQASGKARENLVNTIDQINDPLDLANYIFGAITEAGVQIPLALGTGGASSVIQGIGNIYVESILEQAAKEGVSPEEIIAQGKDDKVSAIAFGALSGMLDQIGAKGVASNLNRAGLLQSLRGRAMAAIEKMPDALVRAGNIGLGALGEGSTEGFQTILEEIGIDMGQGETLIDAFDNVEYDKIVEAMVRGAVGGGALSTLGQIGQSLAGKPETQIPESTPEETGGEVVEGAENNPDAVVIRGGAADKLRKATHEQTVNTEQANEQIIQEAEQAQPQAPNQETQPINENENTQTRDPEVPKQPVLQGSETSVEPDSAPSQVESQTVEEEPVFAENATTETQPVIIKRGENEYQVKNENGALTIITSDGKEPSKKTKQRVTREYEQQYDYTKGDRAPQPDNLEPNSYDGYIAEMSNNPAELADTWQQSKEVGNTEISFKDQVIGEAIGTVDRQQFVRIVGEANVGRSLAKTYLRKDGQKIDLLAQELSDTHGIDIEPQDIADFILDNPNGFNPNKSSKSQQALEDKFRKLTGLSLNERTAGIAIDQALQQEAVAAGMAEKQLNSFIEQEYESEEQIRKAWEQEFGGQEQRPTQETVVNERQEADTRQDTQGTEPDPWGLNETEDQIRARVASEANRTFGDRGRFNSDIKSMPFEKRVQQVVKVAGVDASEIYKKYGQHDGESVRGVLKSLKENATEGWMRTLADNLEKKSSVDLNRKLYFVNIPGAGFKGVSVYNDAIYLNLGFSESINSYEHILLHEIVHLYTSNALSNIGTLNGRDKEFAKKLNLIYREAKQSKSLEDHISRVEKNNPEQGRQLRYSLSNINEFAANFYANNSEFRNALNKVDRGNLWQRIIDALVEWLDLPKTTRGAFEQLMDNYQGREVADKDGFKSYFGDDLVMNQKPPEISIQEIEFIETIKDEIESGFMTPEEGLAALKRGDIKDALNIVNSVTSTPIQDNTENNPPQEKPLNQRQEADARQDTQGAEPDPGFNVDKLGIAGSDSIIEKIGDFYNNAKRDLKKYLKPRGLLPKNVFARKIKMDSEINSEVRQVKYVAKRLKKVLKGQPKSVIRDVDKALKGDIPLSQIPSNIVPVVQEMRSHVDALSQMMIDEGVVQGDLAAKIDDNIGVYLNRSYRAHDDPKGWAKKLSSTPEGQMIRNRAVDFIRSQNPNLSDTEVKGLINELLYQEDGPLGLITGGKLGAKDLGILIKRKDIAPEIRALLGEYSDPLVNYSKSVIKMVNLVAKNKFLQDVRDMGMNDFLFENPTETHYAEIAGKGSKVMDPVNGLYTTPDIAEAFREMNTHEQHHSLFRAYMKLNGFVKMAKTVLSIQTHARNIVGNFFFVAMNGHYRLGTAGKSLKAIMGDMGSKEAWQKKYREYLELGVVYDNPNSGELRAIVNDAYESQDVETMFDNVFSRVQKKVAKGVIGAYQAEDDFFKIMAYENEYVRYKKAMPNATDQQVKEKAADIVRRTYPTYSLVPKAIQSLRQFPLFGTFVSFPAEVLRTTYNTFALTRQELANPETRAIGIQRLIGMTVAAGVPVAMQAYAMMDAGVSEEEDDWLESFVPPWGKNGDRIYIKDGKRGQYSYVDLSYSDPHNYLKQPLKGFMSSLSNLSEGNKDKAIEDAVESTRQLLEPFLSEEILSGRLFDIRSNKKPSGGKIYNEQDDIGQIAYDIYDYMASATEVGTLRSFRRFWKGLHGEVNEYGKTYDPVDEVMAMFTGQRIERLNIAQNMQFKLFKAQQELRDARRIYSQPANSEGNVSTEELQSSLERSNNAVKKILDELKSDYDKAMELGVSSQKLRLMVENENFSSTDKLYILTGKYIELPRNDINKKKIIDQMIKGME